MGGGASHTTILVHGTSAALLAVTTYITYASRSGRGAVGGRHLHGIAPGLPTEPPLKLGVKPSLGSLGKRSLAGELPDAEQF